ncbi:hypothetical protein [Kistimonas asteriae]|uniref:hypothetical protein n=1 Tax=Kistimonas asteriae TaxID=517724 RepID=UPI001BA8AA4B|nr:hypothetical protein [Kistimonas asteriae]
MKSYQTPRNGESQLRPNSFYKESTRVMSCTQDQDRWNSFRVAKYTGKLLDTKSYWEGASLDCKKAYGKLYRELWLRDVRNISEPLRILSHTEALAGASSAKNTGDWSTFEKILLSQPIDYIPHHISIPIQSHEGVRIEISNLRFLYLGSSDPIVAERRCLETLVKYGFNVGTNNKLLYQDYNSGEMQCEPYPWLEKLMEGFFKDDEVIDILVEKLNVFKLSTLARKAKHCIRLTIGYHNRSNYLRLLRQYMPCLARKEQKVQFRCPLPSYFIREELHKLRLK